MPDRYGEDEPLVDLDSRRQARASQETARQQRARLEESRAAHAPLTRQQSAAARGHRNDVTKQAEAHRNTLRIANCRLCDPEGYRGATVCDHVDRSAVAERGHRKVYDAMGWPE